MEVTRPDGTLSIREYATVTDASEASIRMALSVGRITAPRDENGRRWIPLAELCRKYAFQLTSPATQANTLAELRRRADFARVTLSPDEVLVSGAMAYLRGENPNVDTPEGPVTSKPDPWAPRPKAKVEMEQLELAEVGD